MSHYILVEYLNLCRIYNELLIYRPMEPIYNRKTECCEFALFHEKTSISQLCKTKIVKGFLFISIKQNQGWIYATSNLIDILNCMNQSIPKSRHMLDGTGTLEVGQSCSIHRDTFSLSVMLDPPPSTPATCQHY